MSGAPVNYGRKKVYIIDARTISLDVTRRQRVPISRSATEKEPTQRFCRRTTSTRDQSYQTFYRRNLQIFVIS
jgi:hypothetical protein